MIESSIEFAKEIRKHSLEMVVRSRASHIGSALSMTDILAVLYFDLMNVFPKDAENDDDRKRYDSNHSPFTGRIRNS